MVNISSLGVLGSQSLSTFIEALFQQLGIWGSWIVGVIGVVMIIVGIYQIAKGIMSGGKGQTNWVMAILCLLLGGALAAGGGWALLGTFTDSSNTTIDKLAGGSTDGGSTRSSGIYS